MEEKELPRFTRTTEVTRTGVATCHGNRIQNMSYFVSYGKE